VEPATDGRVRRTAWSYAGRALFSVVSTAVMAILLLFSAVLATLKCDENCDSSEQAAWWGYQAQLGLAAAGALLGVVALVVGFTSKTGPYRTLAALSIACWVIWVLWVPGSGNF
jgi:hypothetical protein